MYLQIRIPHEDRLKFRFLWRNLEVDHDPDVYEFERVVFGDASAPFRAQFVCRDPRRDISACIRDGEKIDVHG